MNDEKQYAHIEQTNQKTRKKRLDMCNSCEQFNKESGRCTVCGCIMSIKTTIPFMKCPDGKW